MYFHVSFGEPTPVIGEPTPECGVPCYSNSESHVAGVSIATCTLPRVQCSGGPERRQCENNTRMAIMALIDCAACPSEWFVAHSDLPPGGEDQ